MSAYKIVLIRHGESQWNQLNKFCGWFDADLSDKGIEEAQAAGKLLNEENFVFDVAYTSLLKRAIKTLYYTQEALDLHWIPVNRRWRLNERMYGGLQGLNKAETAEKHGDDQVKIWRRSYDVPPPPIDEDSDMNPAKDPKYKDLNPEDIPRTECLKDVVARFLPLWNDEIVPVVRSGKRVVIVAHGNSLRALVKYLDDVPESEITELNIPTGIPLVYEFDEDMKPLKHYYLGDQEAAAAAAAAVANQATKK